MAVKKTKTADRSKIASSKEETIPSVSIRTDANEAIVTVILDNNPNKKEQKKVRLVVVNNELVPDHNDTNPGVK